MFGERIILVIAVVLIVVLIATSVGAHVLVTFALDTHARHGVYKPTLPEILATAESTADTSGSDVSLRTAEQEWLLSSATEEFITSFDRLRLHAYFVSAAAPTEHYAIIIHGYKGTALDMAAYARHYYDRGWNVLVPTHRAHEPSEGRYIGMGWLEHYDLMDWITHIVSKESAAHIVLHGVSMGAATALLVTGESLPASVRTVVEDCGYTSIKDELKYQLAAMFHMPSFPLLPLASFITKRRAGYSFAQGSCVRAVARSKIPTLFIHGDADTFVPFAMLDEIYRAAMCEKQKLVIPGARHAGARTTDEERYWQTVDKFVDTYIQ
ncbi:MAG: alpha/beta hydrolase [Treponema sp.]|nr:alpha/beta hydrolase [Treponema sp.]